MADYQPALLQKSYCTALNYWRSMMCCQPKLPKTAGASQTLSPLQVNKSQIQSDQRPIALGKATKNITKACMILLDRILWHLLPKDGAQPLKNHQPWIHEESCKPNYKVAHSLARLTCVYWTALPHWPPKSRWRWLRGSIRCHHVILHG